MGPTDDRRAAWLLTVWVEDGQVRGRVAATADVSSPRSTTSSLAGIDPMCASLRAFLVDLVGETGDGDAGGEAVTPR